MRTQRLPLPPFEAEKVRAKSSRAMQGMRDDEGEREVTAVAAVPQGIGGTRKKKGTTESVRDHTGTSGPRVDHIWMGHSGGST